MGAGRRAAKERPGDPDVGPSATGGLVGPQIEDLGIDGEAWERSLNEAGDRNHVIEGTIDGSGALNIEVYRLACSCGVVIEGCGRPGAGKSAADQHHRDAPWED